jgi:hypothetical protein
MSNEARSREVELEEQGRGGQRCTGRGGLRDPDRIEERVFIITEASDAVGGDVELVAKAGDPLQARGELARRPVRVLPGLFVKQLAGEDDDPSDRIRRFHSSRHAPTAFGARALTKRLRGASGQRVPSLALEEGRRPGPVYSSVSTGRRTTRGASPERLFADRVSAAGSFTEGLGGHGRFRRAMGRPIERSRRAHRGWGTGVLAAT